MPDKFPIKWGKKRGRGGASRAAVLEYDDEDGGKDDDEADVVGGGKAFHNQRVGAFQIIAFKMLHNSLLF